MPMWGTSQISLNFIQTQRQLQVHNHQQLRNVRLGWKEIWHLQNTHVDIIDRQLIDLITTAIDLAQHKYACQADVLRVVSVQGHQMGDGRPMKLHQILRLS